MPPGGAADTAGGIQSFLKGGNHSYWSKGWAYKTKVRTTLRGWPSYRASSTTEGSRMGSEEMFRSLRGRRRRPSGRNQSERRT